MKQRNKTTTIKREIKKEEPTAEVKPTKSTSTSSSKSFTSSFCFQFCFIYGGMIILFGIAVAVNLFVQGWTSPLDVPLRFRNDVMLDVRIPDWLIDKTISRRTNFMIFVHHVPMLCMLGAILLWWPVSTLLLRLAQIVQGTTYDNNYPRVQQGQFSAGWMLRAKACHENSFESLPVFLAGVTINVAIYSSSAVYHDVDRQFVMVCKSCLVFLLARIVFMICYAINLAPLRTLAWMIGFVASLHLFAHAMII